MTFNDQKILHSPEGLHSGFKKADPKDKPKIRGSINPLSTNKKSEKPKWLQIKEIIENGIIEGVYQEINDIDISNSKFSSKNMFISTTEIARKFYVNPTTAVKIVRKLSEEGILKKISGIGMCVAQGARKIITEWRTEAFYKYKIGEMLEEAKRLNISIDDVFNKIKHDEEYVSFSLYRLIKQAKRSEDAFSLMRICIDFFKEYNKTYGHEEGLLCLGLIEKIIRETLNRPYDFYASYKGKEFIIALPCTSEEGAVTVAGNILSNVYKCKIPHKKRGISDRVTVSIGVTTSRGKYGGNRENAGKAKIEHLGEEYIKICLAEYINAAEKMLMRAQERGGNQYSSGSMENQ